MRIFVAAFLAVGKLSQGFSPTRSYRELHRTSTTLRMSKRVLVPIADGSEEIETTCITDTLTRFGADVTTASVMPEGQLVCKMSRGIKVCIVLQFNKRASLPTNEFLLFHSFLSRQRKPHSMMCLLVVLRLWPICRSKMPRRKNSI